MHCEVGSSPKHIIRKVAYVEPYVEEDENFGEEDPLNSCQPRNLWNPYNKDTFKVLSGICSACGDNGFLVEE